MSDLARISNEKKDSISRLLPEKIEPFMHETKKILLSSEMFCGYAARPILESIPRYHTILHSRHKIDHLVVPEDVRLCVDKIVDHLFEGKLAICELCLDESISHAW